MVARIAIKGKKKRWGFPGISVNARALGVNRSHLWRVLSGKRRSCSLVARYMALKSKQASEAKGMVST
jgi:hypothetical protein